MDANLETKSQTSGFWFPRKSPSCTVVHWNVRRSSLADRFPAARLSFGHVGLTSASGLLWRSSWRCTASPYHRPSSAVLRAVSAEGLFFLFLTHVALCCSRTLVVFLFCLVLQIKKVLSWQSFKGSRASSVYFLSYRLRVWDVWAAASVFFSDFSEHRYSLVSGWFFFLFLNLWTIFLPVEGWTPSSLELMLCSNSCFSSSTADVFPPRSCVSAHLNAPDNQTNESPASAETLTPVLKWVWSVNPPENCRQ